MDPIETLMSEHRVIEQVLEALLTFAADARLRGRPGEQAELARFVTFLREYADDLHHAKEEKILFAAMVEHGFPAGSGPIGVMLDEHDRCRALVRRLAGHAGAAAWDDQARQDVAETARAFVALLAAHIRKEDGVLYPMAQQHLPAAAIAAVGEGCARAVAERAGRAEALLGLAEALAAAHTTDSIRRTA
jgi:hemerythrin-like domain-containing protein